nr:hypothetical protein OG999_10825 [Streptomyces sp. NBC_00886]
MTVGHPALPHHALWAAAATGGEVFGLSPEGVDFARGVLRIRRQVQLLSGRLYVTLPKGGKTRVVDMPPSVAVALAQYSVILEAGESVVTLARRLGHSSPTITLAYCAHFMPEAGGKGRGAIDALLGQPAMAA